MQRFAIKQDLARDDTNVLALSQHIESSGLACAGSAHECNELTALDVAGDVVEKTAGATGDGDDVVDVLPGEGLAALEPDKEATFSGCFVKGIGSRLTRFALPAL